MFRTTAAPTAARTLAAPAFHSGLALAPLALGTLLATLGVSIANVALPTLAATFACDFSTVRWVVVAYLLAVTTSIVVAGRLGDLVGRRRLLLAGLALFALSSLAGGFAPSIGWLIATRAAQGVGAAILMALTLAMIGDVASPDRFGSAMGLMGTVSAVGTALGPSLGGALIALFGWQAIFLLQAGLGALALALAAHALPAGERLGASGALAGALFSRFELWTKLFREPALGASLFAAALASTVVMATMVVGPFYLSRALGLDAARTGLLLSVGPVVAAAAAAPSGRLVDRLGARRLTLVGLATMAAGSLLLALVAPRFGLAGYAAPIAVLTAGYALFQTANNASVLTNGPASDRGLLSGLLNLARNLGLVTGASAMGALFAAAAAAPNLATASSSAVTDGMRATFGVATLLLASVIALASAAFRPQRDEGSPASRR